MTSRPVRPLSVTRSGRLFELSVHNQRHNYWRYLTDIVVRITTKSQTISFFQFCSFNVVLKWFTILWQPTGSAKRHFMCCVVLMWRSYCYTAIITQLQLCVSVSLWRLQGSKCRPSINQSWTGHCICRCCQTGFFINLHILTFLVLFLNECPTYHIRQHHITKPSKVAHAQDPLAS